MKKHSSTEPKAGCHRSRHPRDTFRGVLFGTVARTRGIGLALVVATVPFVLLHLPETGSHWPALLGIATMAVVANIARLRTGQLASAVATHFGYNLMLVVVAMLAYS